MYVTLGISFTFTYFSIFIEVRVRGGTQQIAESKYSAVQSLADANGGGARFYLTIMPKIF